MMIEAAFCTRPSDVSLMHVLYYANASGGFRYLLEVSGGIQRYRFDGGAHSIPKRLAAKLPDEVGSHGDVGGLGFLDPLDHFVGRGGRVDRDAHGAGVGQGEERGKECR